jgi:hypothetical protein
VLHRGQRDIDGNLRSPLTDSHQEFVRGRSALFLVVRPLQRVLQAEIYECPDVERFGAPPHEPRACHVLYCHPRGVEHCHPVLGRLREIGAIEDLAEIWTEIRLRDGSRAKRHGKLAVAQGPVSSVCDHHAAGDRVRRNLCANAHGRSRAHQGEDVRGTIPAQESLSRSR